MLFPPPLFITFILKAHSCVITQLWKLQRNVPVPRRDFEAASVLHYSSHSHRYTVREICPSAQNQETLSEIYCHTGSPGVVCFISSVLQSKTQSCQQCVFLCVCVCDWLGPGSWLWVCLCVCVFAVKVCEPDGGCGQKERIAKVHITVTLCFLHDKNCLSFPPFALTLPSPPQLLPLTPPSHLSSFPVRGHSSPTVAAGLSHCYSTPYLCHPFNFRLTPFLSLSFGSLSRVRGFVCVRLPPLSHFPLQTDSIFLSSAYLLPHFFTALSQNEWNTSGQSLVICFDSLSQTSAYSITSLESQSCQSNLPHTYSLTDTPGTSSFIPKGFI